jgi:hypothetical protein
MFEALYSLPWDIEDNIYCEYAGFAVNGKAYLSVERSDYFIDKTARSQ